MRKKKIFYLMATLPAGILDGAKIRNLNLLKVLSKRFDIYLLAIIKNEKERKEAEQLKKFCKNIYCILIKKEKKLIKNIFMLFSFCPHCILNEFRSEILKKTIKSICNKNRFDVAIISRIYSTFYLENIKARKNFFDSHNAEANQTYNAFLIEKNLFLKLFRYIEFLKMKYYEIKKLKEFDLCLAVSKEEQKFFEKKCKQVEIIPNFVDYKELNYRSKRKKVFRNRIIFTGNFNYAPNISAIKNFIPVFRKIKKLIPNIDFYIVGKSANKLKIKENSIIIMSDVKDTIHWIMNSPLMLVPLKYGTGTRFKILEAMAIGTPVISTTKGAEGLDVKDGENILIADTPEQFLNQILKLFHNKKLEKTMIKNGKKLIENKYSIKAIEKELIKFLK